ncbi:MAG: GTP pyrophosphokinase family protein [Oscillospiraceae bacterium]
MEISGLNSDTALPQEDEYSLFFLQYRQMMMLYENAVQCIQMRLDLIGKECVTQCQRSPVRSVTSRMKSLDSIINKLKRKGLPLTLSSVMCSLNDVAGVRVICEYIFDAYAIKDALLSGGFIKLINEKDYIKAPKPNGYRSLHLIVDVPVLLFEGEQQVRCEIQIRTTAMDSWAGLEHNLRYKKDRAYDEEIDSKLRKCASMLSETDAFMQEIAEDLGIFDKSL